MTVDSHRTSALFDQLPAARRYPISNLSTGETLYCQGSLVDLVFIIESGYIMLEHCSAAGKRSIGLVLGQGEILAPWLTGHANDSAKARSPTTLRSLPADEFCDLLKNSTVLTQALLQMLATRQQIAENRFRASVTLPLRGRIAVVLHDLTRHYGGRCVHGHELDLPVTQQELADMVGGSRPAVSAELKRMRDDGLVEYTRGFLCIADSSALAAEAEDVSSM